MKDQDAVRLSQLVTARRRDVKRLARWLGVSTEGGRMTVASNVKAEMTVLRLLDEDAKGSRDPIPEDARAG